MRRPNILKKHLYLYHYYFCSYYFSIIITAFATDKNDEINKIFWGRAKKDFKSGTSASISQCRSGHYLLYGRIETHKLHESVYNSFLDTQIKGTGYSFLICLRHLKKKLHESSAPETLWFYHVREARYR